GESFEPKLVKLHKGEQKSPEDLAINRHGQVPVLMSDAARLMHIVGICDYLVRRLPQAVLLPSESWARARALSQLAWMNNTVHPTFTNLFRPAEFADRDPAERGER